MKRSEGDGPTDPIGSSEDVSPVALAFLEQLIQDLEAGEVASTEAYQQRFPGQEDFIARHLASLVNSRSQGGPEVVAGRFELQGILGAGGQSVVHLARDRQLGRQVALKVLRGAAYGRRLTMFEREASVASQLDDARVCGVYDSGVDEDCAWIAMRYVPGETLAARIATWAEAGQPPAGEALVEVLAWFATAARAMHVCHEAGVIHRDIKPSNLMLTEAGDVVVLDFGVARLAETEGQALTVTGERFGTPLYMSPEQIDGSRALDRRTDIYSLGATLFEALALRPPVDADAAWSSASRVRLPDIRRLNPAVSRDLVSVIERVLEVDPRRRYVTAADLAADLEAVAERRPVTARRVGPVGRLVRWSSREPVLATLAGITLIALPTVAALVTLRAIEAPQRAAQQAAERADDHDRKLVQGWLDFASRDYPQAEDRFRRVLAAGPSADQGDEARLGIVLSELRMGRADLARAELDGLDGRLSPFLSQQLRALVLRYEGDVTAADAVEAGLPEPESRADLWAASASALARGQESLPEVAESEVRVAFDRAMIAALINSGPHRISSFALLALAASRTQDFRSRRLVSDAIVAIWPRDPLALYWAGAAIGGDSFRFGGTGGQLSPELRAAFTRAIEIFDSAASLDPSFAEVFLKRGQCAIGLGDLEAAGRSLSRCRDLRPDMASAHSSLGVVRELQGRHAEALACHRRAVDLSNLPEYRLSLGIALHAAGELPEALEVLEEPTVVPLAGQRRDRVGGLLQYARGRVLDQMERDDDAIEAYRHAVELEPSLASAHNNLGALYQERGDLEFALASYRRTVELGPDHPLGWLNVGLVLKELRRFDEALVALRRGHELGVEQPNWPYDSASWIRECEAEVAPKD